jgi:hypothetical protein
MTYGPRRDDEAAVGSGDLIARGDQRGSSKTTGITLGAACLAYQS